MVRPVGYDIFHLPAQRMGPRPRTSGKVPHMQSDQWPTADIFDRLVDLCLQLPFVRRRQSRMAATNVQALYLPGPAAGGPTDAFIDHREFCHLHSLPDGTIHVMLPPELRDPLLDLGWGEPHAVTSIGILPELVLAYAPRNSDELAVVCQIIASSCSYARGALAQSRMVASASIV